MNSIAKAEMPAEPAVPWPSRVAFFKDTAHDLISTPLINAAEHLADRGAEVLILGRTERGLKPVFTSGHIRYESSDPAWSSEPGWRRRLHLLKWHAAELAGKRWDLFVGIDADGLLYATLAGQRYGVPVLYHSLEIQCRRECAGLRARIKKSLEAWLSRRAILTVTQDPMRAGLLARENAIHPDRIATVVNAPRGGVICDRQDWFRSRFPIGSSRRIVLAIGSLIPMHLIDRVVAGVPGWPEDFVLVLHGWFTSGDFERKVRKMAESMTGRVFISTEEVPVAEKYRLFSSADAGLVCFDPTCENTRYVAGAAGKLFDFLRCGVPVIANELPGMKELIESGGCGVVVTDICDLRSALHRVADAAPEWAARCHAVYERHRFDDEYAAALSRAKQSIVSPSPG